MRPTLEEQIAIEKKIGSLSYNDCIKSLRGNPIDFYLHNHIRWLWSIIHWNWFDCTKQ